MQTQILSIKLPKKDDFIDLECFACLHLGNINFNEEKFLRRISIVEKEPNRRFIGMGDYGDCINSTTVSFDKRLAFESIDPRFPEPELQYRYVKDKFASIAKKCIGIHEGNHDWRWKGATLSHYVENMASALNTKYLGYAAFTRLKFFYKSQMLRSYDILSGHGQFNGQRMGGNLNSIEDLMRKFEADVYITAHTHNVLSGKTQILAINDEGHVQKKTRLLVSSGSFLEGYVENQLSYAEKSLKSPLRTGTSTVRFYPYANKLNILE